MQYLVDYMEKYWVSLFLSLQLGLSGFTGYVMLNTHYGVTEKCDGKWSK